MGTPISDFDAFGSNEVGVYSGPSGAVTLTAIASGAITKTKWSDTLPEGWSLMPAVRRVSRRSGRTGAVRASEPQESDITLRVSLPTAALDALRRSWGLPTSTLTGGLSGASPTDEKLVIRPGQLGSAVFSIYAEAPGPVGPRTVYCPRCTVSKLPDLTQDRSKYMDNVVEFNVEEPSDGISAWAVDSAT